MKAKLLVRQRVEVHSSAFAELVIWLLPEPLAGSSHSFKYRLAYVVGGVCVLRYNNEAGKGDHRHGEGGESRYRFKSPERLTTDFLEEIRSYNDEHPHD
jgi:Family of unknown function (DUF6516)